MLAAHDRMSMTSRWDPHWEVTRGLSGPVAHVRNHLTSKHKPVNREKVRLVDPTVSRDEVNPRPRRLKRRGKRGHGLTPDHNHQAPQVIPPPAIQPVGGDDTSGLGERVGGSGTEGEESGDDEMALDVATDEVPPLAPANTKSLLPTTGRPQCQTR